MSCIRPAPTFLLPFLMMLLLLCPQPTNWASLKSSFTLLSIKYLFPLIPVSFQMCQTCLVFSPFTLEWSQVSVMTWNIGRWGTVGIGNGNRNIKSIWFSADVNIRSKTVINRERPWINFHLSKSRNILLFCFSNDTKRKLSYSHILNYCTIVLTLQWKVYVSDRK